MIMIIRKFSSIVAALLVCLISVPALKIQAQEPESALAADTDVLVLPPLFDYPTVPEDIVSWADRSNWLIEHFWDNFDFKQKGGIGQNQLVHAFNTYCVPMRFANRDVTIKSVDKLVGQLSKNPTMLIQFTQAAERVLYNPQTAEVMIDEVYIRFLKALLDNKKAPKLYKARYEGQYKALSSSMTGNRMPRFNFMDRNGVKTEYSPEAITTVIEFGDPDCSDCRITRLRLETDAYLQQKAKDGQLRIYFITPDVVADDMESWKAMVADYPHYWTVGAAEGLEDEIDLRITPCLYLIDASRNIVDKAATPDGVHKYLKSIDTAE